MHKFTSVLLFISILCAFSVKGEELVKLEHTFDGYYLPYNYSEYEYGDADDEFYFYSPTITPVGDSINLETYNEDYSLRDSYSVKFAVPSGYYSYSVTFSPSLKLTDGTPFFIVVFMSHEPSGNNYYYKVHMFDANTGEMIADLGTNHGYINVQNIIYEINGKPSIVIVYYNFSGTKTYYTTKIYSLGTPKEESDVANVIKHKAQPLRTFDMNGREITNPTYGQPYIYQMEDGSAKLHMTIK